ncbi:MAG: cytochrome c1 [Hyphomonadaceae bacterium JAD_PAG50586_4]|nr:MAG: cytochrome c1 [Hyphomonadaceae bacterium JAD_PAG50586_4]
MAPPLDDDIVEYPDDTLARATQMARDVSVLGVDEESGRAASNAWRTGAGRRFT